MTPQGRPPPDGFPDFLNGPLPANFDLVEKIAPHLPKWKVTITCKPCKETYEVVQTSPSAEMLRSFYGEIFKICPSNPSHGKLDVKIEEVARGTESHGPRMVPTQ